MRASALALVLTVALLAGCGSSSKTARPNDEASKPPVRVLADARAAAASAGSAHISGNVTSAGMAIALDLDMARDKGAKGSISLNGRKADILRIGNDVYVHGSDAFWQHYAGAALAQLLHGRWVKASINSSRFGSLRPLTSLSLLLERVSSSHGKLVNDGQTTYKSEQVVAIRDTSDSSKLYVAATGKPYPVALVGDSASQSGTISFGDWNKPVSLSAPSDAIDISQFGG